MDTRTVFASMILVILILVIVLTWKTYPYAKYIVMSRADGESRFIAVGSIEVIDNRGSRHDISSIEGKNQLPAGYSNTAAAALNTAAKDVTLNGKNLGYFKDDLSATAPVVGPVVAAITSANATAGYIIFTLGCPTKIARITITSEASDMARLNLQRTKVYLLDKDKNPIKGAEQIIPISGTIPSTTHHIRFV